MRIAITANGKDLTSNMDPRFGRALGFIIYNTEDNSYTYKDNSQVLNAPQGAGIQAAQQISKEEVQTVITGHVGPNAFKALNSAGISIFLKKGGTVKEAINDLIDNNLLEVKAPDVEGHWV